MINQVIVIACLIDAKAVGVVSDDLGATVGLCGLRQAGEDTPVEESWRKQCDLTGVRFKAMRSQIDACAVKKAVCFIEMRPAHRKIPGVNGGRNVKWANARLSAPAMVIKFNKTQTAIARTRKDRFDLARKIPNQVTARNPGR